MSSHRIDHSGVEYARMELRVKLASVQPTDIVIYVATSVANVAGPSAAKVISRGTAVSVPTTTATDHGFLAICPGLLPKDTAIIAPQWAASKVQRCVCVCVCARACECVCV